MWDPRLVEEVRSGKGDDEDGREVGDLGSVCKLNEPSRRSMGEIYQFAQACKSW